MASKLVVTFTWSFYSVVVPRDSIDHSNPPPTKLKECYHYREAGVRLQVYVHFGATWGRAHGEEHQPFRKIPMRG